MPLDTEKVDKGYSAFFLTIISFPAYFPEAKAGGAFLDLPYFTVIRSCDRYADLRRRNGRERWLPFALELAPSVILSLGIIAITDGLLNLRAAQQY